MISGLIAVVLVSGATTLGVKFSFGAFDDGYDLKASFAAAGQGLINDSDVKLRGVNIGRVKGIELVDGRALVTLFINDSDRIPRSADAVIRPKTLFGEKFVDIVPGDLETSSNPDDFYRDGDTFPQEKTLGGFELEKVLTDTYPILQAIDPAELANVIGTLADAGEGLGPSINRQIVNTDELLDVSVAHDADFRQFVADLALLSEELAGRAGDVVGGAQDLNQALPVLTERGDRLNTLLVQAARLSGDLADLLDNNREFIEKNIVQGGETIQILFDERAQLAPTVTGLRQYLQTLTEAAHVALDDGTLMAGVKAILGGDLCALFPDCLSVLPPLALAAPEGVPPLAPATVETQPPTLLESLLDSLGLGGLLPSPTATQSPNLITTVLGLLVP